MLCWFVWYGYDFMYYDNIYCLGSLAGIISVQFATYWFSFETCDIGNAIQKCMSFALYYGRYPTVVVACVLMFLHESSWSDCCQSCMVLLCWFSGAAGATWRRRSIMRAVIAGSLWLRSTVSLCIVVHTSKRVYVCN